MTPDDDEIAQAAAEWLVRLSSDDAGERAAAQTGFDDWKRADARHAVAAAEMERFLAQMQSLRAGSPDRGQRGSSNQTASSRALHAALEVAVEPATRRRTSATARASGWLGALLVLVVLPVVLAWRAFPPGEMLADLKTPTGEQRSVTLPDGTQLILETSSAVNYTQTPRQRRVELVSGEILVEVAKDAERPFVVETVDGRIRALGTRFIVRRGETSTLLTMLESETAVQAGRRPEVRVQAGQQASLRGDGVELLGPVAPGLVEDAFRYRRLVVQNRPLPEVLDELGRYRSGVIEYEREEVEDIRVSAVLPLDDTDRALQLLLANFPQLRMSTVTPWIVLIGTAPR